MSSCVKCNFYGPYRQGMTSILVMCLSVLYYSFRLRVSHWSLSDSKLPQVFRNLFSILADLNNNVAVWMVSTRPLISKIPVLVSIFWCTNNNWYHRHVPHFFKISLTRPRNLSFFSLSFNFTLSEAGTAKSAIRQVLCSRKKISRKIIRRIISPNQDDVSYSTRVSFTGSGKLGKLPNTLSLAGERRPVQTSHWPFFNSNSSMDTCRNLSNLWIPCKESQLNTN